LLKALSMLTEAVRSEDADKQAALLQWAQDTTQAAVEQMRDGRA
jgi:hypothetical protein